MCGISGIVAARPLGQGDVSLVRRLGRALRHRGPDGSGEHVAKHVALGHERLSIIDTLGGGQPLYNEDRSLVLVANGEIYNHVALQKTLVGLGHHFRTGSDCETILHAYEQWGQDFLGHLRGMFAFALWDERKGRLLLVRDRLGEKPLYYYHQGGQSLVFSSELRALVQSGAVPLELDPASMDLYFHYQYVPEPRTPIKGLQKLPAGHLLCVDTTSWAVEQKPYWNFLQAPALEKEPIQALAQCLEETFEIVVRSDRPIGISLSGGLDSSAVAALARRHWSGELHAFSVGYPGRPPCDERDDARELATHLGLIFHEVELVEDSMVGMFPRLVHLRDDPIADIAGYGYWAVSNAASQAGVPVLLSGAGGDELFWGYPWLQEALRKNPARQNGPPGHFSFYDCTPDFVIAAAEARRLYGPAMTETIESPLPSEIFQPGGDRSRPDLLCTELAWSTYLLENGLAQSDRLSMANSVELRLPLMDHRVVETAVGLRKAQPDDNQPPKNRLRQTLAGVLPEEVLNRPKKGFSPPVRRWHDRLFEKYGALVADGLLVQHGVLAPDKAAMLSLGPLPEGAVCPLSFKALALEMWIRGLAAPVAGKEDQP